MYSIYTTCLWGCIIQKHQGAVIFCTLSRLPSPFSIRIPLIFPYIIVINAPNLMCSPPENSGLCLVSPSVWRYALAGRTYYLAVFSAFSSVFYLFIWLLFLLVLFLRMDGWMWRGLASLASSRSVSPIIHYKRPADPLSSEHLFDQPPPIICASLQRFCAWLF